jgi:hypothetical protein
MLIAAIASDGSSDAGAIEGGKGSGCANSVATTEGNVNANDPAKAKMVRTAVKVE